MKKIVKKLSFGVICLACALCAALGIALNNEVVARAETKSLAGFSSSGASVFIATDDSNTKQMRFELNLASSAEEKYKAAAAGKTLKTGVVILPYDIYLSNEVTELTKDTEGASITDVTSLWKSEEDGGGYVTYAYLPASVIPEDQYNRVFVARGYIEDGNDVYYTDEVKASMAYVAWKNLGMEDGAYEEQLKAYMGPYTLTYGAGDENKLDNLYYGDTLSLPATIGTHNVDKWYWDAARTNEIKNTDYATGSMNIYYSLEKFHVTGTVSCTDDTVDLTEIKISANGEDTAATVDSEGGFSLDIESGEYDFVFECDGYIAYKDVNVTGVTAIEEAVELKDSTFAIGNHGSLVSSTDVTYDKTVALGGSVAISAQKPYTLYMPNTATADEAEYNIGRTYVTFGEVFDEIKNDQYYGFGLSDGKRTLTFTFNRWHLLDVRVSGEYSFEKIINMDQAGVGQGNQQNDYKIVRKRDEISLFVGGICVLTLTEDGMTLGKNVHAAGWSQEIVSPEALEPFFGADEKLALMLAYNRVSSPNAACEIALTYTYEINKLVNVTGTLSCADNAVDLTATTLKIDGKDKDITVNADGTYAALVPEGEHEFMFFNGIYGAKKNVTVSVGDTNVVNATLEDSTYVAGNYGSQTSQTSMITSHGTDTLQNLNEYRYTMSGENHFLLMPYTATTEAFTYQAYVSNFDGNRNDKSYGICISNGTYALSVGFYQWAVILNITTNGNPQSSTCYRNALSSGYKNEALLKFVVTQNEIKFYYDDTLYFTFKDDGFTDHINTGNPPWNKDSLTTTYNSLMHGFFGENKDKLVCGIAGGLNGSVTAQYDCTVKKMVPVTGTVSCASNAVDLTATTLKIDGKDTDITVNADGTYTTAPVTVGSHEFMFFNGIYGAKKNVTVSVGDANVVDATLEDCTYVAGNYGTQTSQMSMITSQGVDTYENKNEYRYTMSGQNHFLLMPYTATTEAFTYQAYVSNVVRSNTADSTYGICISNGTYALSVGFYEWSVVLNITTNGNTQNIKYYSSASKNNGGALKFVVTQNEIKFYYGDTLYFTFTAEGITTDLAARPWSESLTPNYVNAVQGFFGENKDKLVCGIAGGLNGSVTAQYDCTVKKMVSVTGTVSCANSTVDLTATTLKIDGIDMDITVKADGTYTALAPVGAHEFTFFNGIRFFTKTAVTATVSEGDANVVNATLEDSTYVAGNYGSQTSQTSMITSHGPDTLQNLNEYSYTMSGQNHFLLMSYTATTEAFTYQAYVSNVVRSNTADSTYGICISNGTYALSVGFYEWSVVLNITTNGNTQNIKYYSSASKNNGGALKFVVAQNEIKFYYNDTLYFTFTAEGITTDLAARPWSESLTPNYVNAVQGFFGENKDKLVCGIAGGLNGSVTAQYDCTYTINE